MSERFKSVLGLVLVLVAFLLCGVVEARASESPAKDRIKARCKRDWPDNYSMQRFCIEEQQRDLGKLVAWTKGHGVSQESCAKDRTVWCGIFGRCSEDWCEGETYGCNWGMVLFCCEEQEKDYRELQK